MIARISMLLLVLLTSTFAACRGGEEGSGEDQPNDSGPVTLEDFIEEDELSASVGEQKILHVASICLQVDTIDSAEDDLTTMTQMYGGYIANVSRQASSGERVKGEVELRIPSENFHSVLYRVRILGRVESEQIRSRDVTEEFIDLRARINTQRTLESRLLDLLAKRTGKLADVIEVEQKLASVREDIESSQGQLHSLQHQVSFSTLAVTFVEPEAVGTKERDTFADEVRDAFDEGADGLVAVAVVLVRLAVIALPLLLTAFVLYHFLSYLIRVRRTKQRRGN